MLGIGTDTGHFESLSAGPRLMPVQYEYKARPGGEHPKLHY